MFQAISYSSVAKIWILFFLNIKIWNYFISANIKSSDFYGVEKAEQALDLEEAEKLEKQLQKNKFDLDDYLAQLRQIKKMGSVSSLLKMLPGADKLKDVKVDDKEFIRIEAIITSMTTKERKNPSILNGSRRKRIAKGSGTQVHEINKFMESFEMTQKMMKQMKTKGGMKRMMKGLKLDQMDEFKDLM